MIAIDDLAAAARYVALIDKLDLPTKIALLTGATGFTLAHADAIGLGEVRLSDGPSGVRGPKFVGGRFVALLPNATLIASAWSEETAYLVGRLLAEEAVAQHIHLVLGPAINLHRSPLGGRLFESFSEDPLLTGKLAASYVRGMQDLGVGACLKHLIANESETDRTTMDSVVDEATLRELYLLPFEIAVSDSNAWSMMAAYNRINGVAATEQHHVNTEIVKGEWAYTGLIMSDWYATKTAARSANGGQDLVMPGPKGPWGQTLVNAVESGEVAEAVIDDHVLRLLRLADRVGALGNRREFPQNMPAPDSPERRQLLKELAAAGVTVLTNDNQVLPLSRSQHVAVIGRHAAETVNMGGGSARVTPPHQVSVATGIVAILGNQATVVDGVEVRTRPVSARTDFVTDPQTGSPCMRFTLYSHDGSVIEERLSQTCTTSVGIDDDFDAATVFSIGFEVKLAGYGRMQIGVMGAGSWRLSVGGKNFELEVRLAGLGPSEDVLVPPIKTIELDVSAGAIVAGTVVLRPANGLSGADDPPSNFRRGLFGLIARPAPRAKDDVIRDAVAAAEAADVAVVVVGLTEEQETESVDKTTLHLPGAQDELVSAVAAASRRTVVVVNAATPIIMPWLKEVDAVIWAGLPGQEGGHAIAASLFGDIEPSGRLVTTFPAADGASPAWSVTPTDGQVQYSEGTFIGHRGHFAGRAAEPAFWFGYGLGYSTWEYSNAQIAYEGEDWTVAVDVKNSGFRASREVVQVYFRPVERGQPVRLVGWQAVAVAAGETVAVTVSLDRRLWRRWDTTDNKWSQLAFGGELLLARGLGDIRVILRIQ